MKTKTTNEQLRNLILSLRRLSTDKNIPLWKRVAKDLEKSVRLRRQVNLSRINQNTKAGEIALVPGKVLASGELDKKITIAAWRFSDNAFNKISNSKAEAVSIEQLMSKNPQGKKVRIIG